MDHETNTTIIENKKILDLDQNIKVELNCFQQQLEDPKEANEETNTPSKITIDFMTKYQGKLLLHWAVFRGFNFTQWTHPPKENFPENTSTFDINALQTEFLPKEGEEERRIQIILNQLKEETPKTQINGFNYVFFSPEGNRWFNNDRQNYQIKFNRKKAMTSLQNGLTIPDFVHAIVECETCHGAWTLMHRYHKCHDIIKSIDSNSNNDDLFWVFIWLRFSYQRQLDWQRNFNTRPVELSHATGRLSGEVTSQYARACQQEKPYDDILQSKAALIKNILSLLGKGTGNGQQIRDEILHIMHRNKIKLSGDMFYEQWHQKLHNNTTPDDIIICQAIINFLRSGKIEDYRNTLNEAGVTKEILASYERNITLEPFYKPQYIPELENFLRILKSVHSSSDLVMMYNGVQRFFGNIREIDEILKHKDDKDGDVLYQLERLVHGRNVMKNMISGNTGSIDKLRELLFLEISLEMYARQLVEKIIHIKLDLYGYVQEIKLILQNIIISYPHYRELLLAYDDWLFVTSKVQRGESGGLNREGLLKLKAICGRLSRLLSQIVDSCNNNLDLRAKYLGKECNIDKYYTDLFTEEMIRGTIFFALSILLKKLEPIIRKQAKLGDWLIISRGSSSVAGKLIRVKALIDVQYEKYKEKTLIITEKINGNEEIPDNCISVIMNGIDDSYPDTLAHVSVRARNLNVLFAVCFEEKMINEIMSQIDKNISLRINSQNIEWSLIKKESDKDNDSINDTDDSKQKPKVLIEDEGKEEEYDKDIIELDQYDSKYVGAKSLNSKVIYRNITKCDWLKYPKSFSLPFHSMSYFLSLEPNSSIKNELTNQLALLTNESLSQESTKKIQEILLKCKSLTKSITFPNSDNHTQSIDNRLIQCGLDKRDMSKAYDAIKSVWASKYNERVFLSATKANISINQIRIAVLVQNIISSDYAFVIHTKNPSTNNAHELYAEVVNGLGEVLVGAYEGQPFAFVYDKGSKKFELKSYQNKSVKLTNSGLIFRSDSNIEDLEGFSGAGLFDSIPLNKDEVIQMSYVKDELYNNESFRNNLIEKIAMIGIQTEELYNGIPQDIEGVYSKGEYYIVQTRPQV